MPPPNSAIARCPRDRRPRRARLRGRARRASGAVVAAIARTRAREPTAKAALAAGSDVGCTRAAKRRARRPHPRGSTSNRTMTAKRAAHAWLDTLRDRVQSRPAAGPRRFRGATTRCTRPARLRASSRPLSRRRSPRALVRALSQRRAGTADDGGSLRLYSTSDSASTSYPRAARSSRSSPPTSSTKSCPRRRERAALTGWFRRRAPGWKPDRLAARLPQCPRRAASPSPRADVAPAMWQAEHVRAHLAALYPGTSLGVLGVPGAVRRARARASRRGKRTTMIKDLEAAMADGRADLAVHALKNLPPEVSPGFTIASIIARDDPRDAFVSQRFRSLCGDARRRGRRHVEPSPSRAVARAPSRRSTIKALRGDVDARLRALDTGRCDALIVAAASLKRSGYASRIAHCSSPTKACPRRAKARSRSSAAAIGLTSSRRSRRWPIARRRSRRPRSARSRACSAARCRRLLPPMPSGRKARCGCADCSRARTAASCCAANAMRKSTTPKVRSRSAAISPTNSSRAAPRGC